MRQLPYSNAEDILPPKLLRELQRYFQGILYVPPDVAPAERHRLMVMNMAMHGGTTAEIAAKLRISPRRVRQILAEERRLKRTTASRDIP